MRDAKFCAHFFLRLKAFVCTVPIAIRAGVKGLFRGVSIFLNHKRGAHRDRRCRRAQGTWGWSKGDFSGTQAAGERIPVIVRLCEGSRRLPSITQGEL